MAGAAAPAPAVEPGLIQDILANRVENVRQRLMHGEDPDQTNLGGTPAILVAINENNTEIVHLLLHFSATIAYLDNNQNTLLHYAVQPPVKDIMIIRAIVETANNVLYVQRTNIDGQSAYHGASAFQTPHILYYLGRRGGSPVQLDNSGQSSIYIAAAHGNLPNVRFLHSEMLVDINVRDQYGRTPLYAAAQGGFSGIVDYLLRAGANASIPDNDGRTPMQIASDNGHDAVVRLFTNVIESRLARSAWARRREAVSAWAAARAAEAAENNNNGAPATAPPRVGLPRENAEHPNIPGRRNQRRPRKTRRRRTSRTRR